MNDLIITKTLRLLLQFVWYTVPSFMKYFLSVLALVLLVGGIILSANMFSPNRTTGAPPYDASDMDNVTDSEIDALLRDWKRPEGPAKVALQVGHLNNEEVPDELRRLRGNTGAMGGGMTEAKVNLAIAEATKELLEKQGISVELLPATVPEHYWADVFVAIHADGHEDMTKTGFKAAAPRRDYTGNSNNLLVAVRESYEKTTGLMWDEETITRNMRGYYAFSWWRYDHAVHPMTASVILETGFLTSPSDRDIIVDQPELSAEGLADGIVEHLTEKKLLRS